MAPTPTTPGGLDSECVNHVSEDAFLIIRSDPSLQEGLSTMFFNLTNMS